ncbi:MAG: GNAT family N-acetyltransferase [Chloroflexi bacterium]|nr:GNAT family N-acetyltransferase [Chloroflexota bacterium]
MNIRAAHAGDIELCARLDGSYQTEQVWQLDELVSASSMHFTFRQVRAPRSFHVPYPRSLENLREDWQRQECFLVAHEQGRALGFLDMTVQREQWCGWIQHLIVDPEHRRQGIATALLAQAEAWARGSELLAVRLVVQSKNGPAIALFTSRGYAFCGFIEHHYKDNDTGFIYSYDIS